jgi:Zn-dependent peptidase ImmA (M78 family)/transcriptional regulator with XRE-family HTH domain
MSLDFIGQNLRLMRLFHGLTLQELGADISVSKQFLSRLESGLETPTRDLQDDLARRLQVKPSFFGAVDPMPITEEQCHFRKQLTTKASLRQQARARGELFKRLVTVLDRELELPAYGFKETEPHSMEAIENAAERSRVDWGLGFGPIANVVRVAETAGAVVVRMSEIASEIDAISFATPRPVIALNSAGRSACRARFGVAHEIGHLVLHIGVLTGDKMTESEANRFASAFLMPRAIFTSECQRAIRGTRTLNWSVLSEIKMRWGVSKAAILYRGRQLGVFSEDLYKSGVITLTRHGEARAEHEDDLMVYEEPEVLPSSLDILASSCGLTLSDIAASIHVGNSIVRSLLSETLPSSTASGNVLPIFGSREAVRHQG